MPNGEEVLKATTTEGKQAHIVFIAYWQDVSYISYNNLRSI